MCAVELKLVLTTTHLFSTSASGSASQLLLKQQQQQQQPWRSTPPPPPLSSSNPGSRATGSTSQLFLKQQQQPWGTTTPLLQALTTSPEFFDLTSDSEVSREHTSSGKVKRSRLAAGLGELTLIAESSSTSLGIQAEGDDDVGLFPNEDGFVDMGLLPYPPFTRWGFRYPKKSELPFSKNQLRLAYGTDTVGGHIKFPLPMPLFINFDNDTSKFMAAFEEYLRLLRFYRKQFGDACICIWLDDPTIPIPAFKLAPPPPRPHPLSCLAITLEEIRSEESVQPLTKKQKDDRISVANLIDNLSVGKKGSNMGVGRQQSKTLKKTLGGFREIAGDKTLKVPGFIVGATGAPKHQMNIAYGLQEQGKSGVVQEPGSYYRGSVSHDSREHTKMQFSGPALASFLSSISDPTIRGHYHANAAEHDASGGGKTKNSKTASAVQSWARARTGTGEVSHDQALEENDDRFGTRLRFSVPAVNARIAADVHAGTISSAAEGRRTQDALHGTKFFESTAGVIASSSAIAAATNTTRTAVLIEGDRKKGSKVAQSGPGLMIELSDNFRQSNEDKFDIIFFPDRRVSFKEGVKELEQRLHSHNSNRTLKRLIDEIKSGKEYPTATSGSLTFMLLKKGAATPQMQIVSTAQRLPSTKPSNWNALITSSPMPIGYNDDYDGKQDGVKPSKAPLCEPTDLAKKEYAAFKTTLAPWYREEKKLKDGDTVYLEYSRVNMNPIVFHEKTRMESIIKLGESKNVTKTLALIEKHEISTLKGASVIVFRC